MINLEIFLAAFVHGASITAVIFITIIGILVVGDLILKLLKKD